MKKIILIVIIIFCLAFLSIFYNQLLWLVSPQNAYSAFLSRICAEDQIVHPLVISGSKVIPLLLNDIFNKSMKNRAYAMGYLGDIKAYSALPALIKIYLNPEELDAFRYEAFESITKIDAELSIAIGIACQVSLNDHLYNKLLSSLKSKQEIKFKKGRSFFEAWVEKHE